MTEVTVKFKGFEKLEAKIIKGGIDGSNAASFKMHSHIVNKHLTGGTSDTSLGVRSGGLRNATKPILAKEQSKVIKSGVFFNIFYASTHVGRKGKTTTITPKKSKWLTIPIGEARTKGGRSKKLGARSYGDLTFIPTRGGSPILARVDSATATVTPLFLLKKKVVIPTRVHPEQIEKEIKPELIKILDFHIDRELRI